MKADAAKRNPRIDAFLSKAKKWPEELRKLREIALACPLAEELKWGKPAYTFAGGNVVILIPFKEYCAMMFFKGALLKDPHGILEQQTENTQAARIVRFTNVREIGKLKPILKAYLLEAIAAEKAGLKVTYKETSEFAVPVEFQNQLDTLSALKAAFHALTPGRQRAYLLYFSRAKQSKTRASRVAKCLPQILKEKGLDD